VCLYILINTLVWVIEKASGGRIVPHNKDKKDPWTWRIPGGVLPPWLVRASKGKRDFWRADDRSVSEAQAVGAAPAGGVPLQEEHRFDTKASADSPERRASNERDAAAAAGATPASETTKEK
jgi:hypothetical protein